MALKESEGVVVVVEKDTLGGTKFTLDSGVYEFTVKSMYPVKNKGGSSNMQLVLETPDKKLFNPSIYFIDAKGSMTTVATYGDEKGKTVDNIGKRLLDSICQMAVGKSLVQVSNSEEKKMVVRQFSKPPENIQVDMYMDMIGAKVTLGILETRKNKQTDPGNGGKWIDTNEERIENTIHKVFSSDGFTKEELDKKVPTPIFITGWKEKYQGQLQDKFKPVTGGVTTGVPKQTSASSF
jgi:hypothetical protein